MIRALIAALMVLGAGAVGVADDAGPVYELRIYTCEPGKLEPLQARFRDHTIRIFERHGIKNVAYWTPTDGDAAQNTLIYLLEHASRDAAKVSWDAFRNDPDWKEVAAASREQHGKILSKAPESTYLVPTEYSPPVTTADPQKLYELRIYKTGEGKLDALHARFRDHTDSIFKRHGLIATGYFSPQDEPKSKNELVYLLQTENRDAAKAAWKAFGQDPEWRAAYAESTKEGRLLAERPISIYMRTTDFSPKP